MEPFGAEECHSSESGWTMYIGSPIDDDRHSDHGHSHHKNKGTQAHPQDYDYDYDGESDDSMASDASSGPSHHGVNHGFADFLRPADENKYCLENKANQTQHKQMEGKKEQNKGMLFVDNQDKSPVDQHCGKVRKNYFVGKRK